nr:hypothetical protein [Angustibacter aerolatus]
MMPAVPDQQPSEPSALPRTLPVLLQRLDDEPAAAGVRAPRRRRRRPGHPGRRRASRRGSGPPSRRVSPSRCPRASPRSCTPLRPGGPARGHDAQRSRHGRRRVPRRDPGDAGEHRRPHPRGAAARRPRRAGWWCSGSSTRGSSSSTSADVGAGRWRPRVDRRLRGGVVRRGETR